MLTCLTSTQPFSVQLVLLLLVCICNHNVVVFECRQKLSGSVYGESMLTNELYARCARITHTKWCTYGHVWCFLSLQQPAALELC